MAHHLAAADHPMSPHDLTSVDELLEMCIDEVSELVNAVNDYPLITVALALRVHLAALLRIMFEEELCTRDEVREFARLLEKEAMPPT